MLIYVLEILVVNAMILIGPFFWVQRFSNSPGNVVWIFMFFLFGWNPNYKTLMLIIGILVILVSAITLGVNIVAGVMGISSGIKKALMACWGVGMIIMLINEVIAIAAYIENSKYSSYNDM